MEARAVSPREFTLPVVALAMVGFGAFSERAEAVSVALIAIGAGMFFIGLLLPTLTEFQIGPSGFSGKLRERDQEVQAALEPHSEGLLRTAVTIAGSPEKGRELLDQALVETYMQWQQAKRDGPADTVLKRLGDIASAEVSSAAPGASP